MVRFYAAMHFILDILYHVSVVLCRSSPLQDDSIRKILLIETSRLGDVVSALRGILALKGCFPHAEFSLVVDERFSSFVRNWNVVDRVIGFDGRRKPWGLIGCILRVRRGQFDLVCSLSPIRKNAIIALLGRTKYAVGYLRPGPKVPNFLKQSDVVSVGFHLQERVSYGKENITLTALKVAEALGGRSDHNRVSLRDFYKPWQTGEFVEEHTFPPSPFVVIHPFAGWRYREWLPERVVELAREIVHQCNSHVLLVGSKGEATRLHTLERRIHLPGRVSSFPSESVDALALFIMKSSAVIGMDSGPLHLAAALGVPCVGLYGPAAPRFTGPVAPHVEFLFKEVECSPCTQKRCVRAINPCLNLITVDEVVGAVTRTLTRQAVPNYVA